MNPQLRSVIVAVVLGLLAVCVFGLRFACNPADLSAIHRNEELEQLREATYRRVDARRRVVREVIDRHCTLSEALERLRELDREWPDYREETVEVPALGSTEERSYRYLRAEVEEILSDRPEEAAAVLRLLEKDYRQLQADRQTPSSAATERTEQRVVEGEHKIGR